MNPDYILLPLAIVCLWTPGAVIASSSVKAKLRQSARRQDEGLGAMLRSKFNWLDLARAAAGAWLIQRQIEGFHTTDDDLRWIITGVHATVLIVGVVAQTIWFDQKIRVIGPLFFLTGITLVVSGLTVGGFGLALGLTCALMFRQLSSCFVLIALCLAGFGVFFHRLGIMTLLDAGLCAFPLILSFARDTPLGYVRRPTATLQKKTPVRSSSPQPKPLLTPEDVIPEKEMVPNRVFSGSRAYVGADSKNW